MEKRFEFFSPIDAATSGAGIVPNLSFGAQNVDVHDLKKNIPHFEELATQFGLQAIKNTILSNTLQFAQNPKQRALEDKQFPAPVSGKDTPIQSVGQNTIFGFPVYSNLAIRAGSYKNNQGVTIGNYSAINLEAVIFEITRENNLVLTDIQGRDNSVIEYISKKSWRINCKGRIMTPQRNTYPRIDVDNFITALDSNKSLQVDSWFLNMAGIYNMVVVKKTIPQEEGSLEYQKFEFDAIADFPVLLKIQK